jgi:hypothetical protein
MLDTRGTLERLEALGLLPQLYKNGLINTRAFMALPTRHRIDGLMKQGLSHGQAVELVAKSMRLSRGAIYSYLRVLT